MQAQALQLGRTRVVSFALCGAVLHQLRKPRNAWAHNGGHVAAQAAADALVVDDERARAREAEEVRDIAPAHDGEEGRHLASIEATTSGKCEDGVGAEGDGACAGQPEDERLCRFCFGAASEMPGGLISPCKCKGTQAYVHLACVRDWQRTTFRARGVFEHSCRVCHHPFSLPPRPIPERVAEWFRPRAADRLAVWSAAWTQILANTLVPLQERRVGSLRDIGLILLASEVRVWGVRELRRGRPPLLLLKRLVAATEAAQLGAVACWALAAAGRLLGDGLSELEAAALRGRRPRVLAPLLIPLFGEASKVLTLPLRAFVRFGEPLYRVVQFVERFPQFRL